MHLLRPRKEHPVIVGMLELGSVAILYSFYATGSSQTAQIVCR